VVAVHYYQLRVDTVDAHPAGTPGGFNTEKEIFAIVVIAGD
jgi:hypothetical protein